MKFELKDRLWIDGKILYECEGYVDNQPYTLYDKEEKDERIPVSVDTGSNVNLLVASLIEIRTMEEHIVLYAGGSPVSYVYTNEMFVHIETNVFDSQYGIVITLTRVPFYTYAGFIDDIRYPLAWISDASGDLTQVNSVTPPIEMLRIALDPKSFSFVLNVGVQRDAVRNSQNAIVTHINDWHSSKYGICVGAVISLDMGESTAAGLFRGRVENQALFTVANIYNAKFIPMNGASSQTASSRVTLNAFEDQIGSIELPLEDLIYRYRGVWSVNSIVIDDKNVHICMNGMRIKRKISIKLKRLVDAMSKAVSDVNDAMIPAHVVTEDMPVYKIAEDIYNHLMDKYTSGKMTDEVLICQKDFMYSMPVIKFEED